MDTETVTIPVRPALTGTIDVVPDPPIRNRPATVSVTPSGGTAGYTFAWDIDDDGAFDDGTSYEVDTTFATLGAHVVRVRIRDSATNQHETIVTRTLTVTDPPAPPPGTPEQPPAPKPPPPCTKRLVFELSEITTTGCFTQTGVSPSARWATRSQVKVNGIVFPDFGQTFTIELPTPDQPGGRFVAPNSTIKFGGCKVFAGDVDWQLPAGKEGDPDKTVETFSIALGSQIFGLNVKGTTAVRMGFRNGTHYATFPLTIELPAGIETGPNRGYSRATGSASLRVDDAGVHYDGLKLSATNVWLGKVKLVEVCFSFIPSGGQAVDPCPASSIIGEPPFIDCKTDVNTNRWDGNATIQLPGKSNTTIGVFGGLANGTVSKLGGVVDGLGRRVPLAPQVFLNRLGIGLCLTPPPFQLRGDIGVNILPIPEKDPTVGIIGKVVYSDGEPGEGWQLRVGGNVKVLGTQLGEGSVTIRESNVYDFNVEAGFNAYDIVSLNGQIDGWVDLDRSLFNLEGIVRACVGGAVCAQGSGLASSVGAAGCVTIASTVSSPDLLVSFDPFRVRFDTRPLLLTAGFGYRWGASSPDLFASSCSFGPYRQAKSAALARAAASGAPLPVRVAPGTDAVTLRIRGTKGVPKVVVRGPGGVTITSPAKATGAQRKGVYLLAENRRDRSTNVVLVRPAAGTWTVSAAPGASSRPTRVETAASEAPPTLDGAVRTSGGRRVLDLAYAVPAGTSVRLVERAGGIGRTLRASVEGRRCPAGPATRPGTNQRILCAQVRFRPSRGPGGRRTIQAVVSRRGIPIAQQDVATFRAPKQTRPSRVVGLRAHRANGFLVVAFPRSRGASRYAVSVSLSDGRELGFDLDARCEEIQIPHVPAGVGATVTVAGVRYDMVLGDKRKLVVRPGVTNAGRKAKVPRSQWRPRVACQENGTPIGT